MKLIKLGIASVLASGALYAENIVLNAPGQFPEGVEYNTKTGELSSGQKNRVSLAKSLINNPEILFLDEPTASLDPDIGDFVRSYIQEYKSKNKVTIILASHNMSEVERLCDSVIMMRKGKIIDEGTCKSLIQKHGRNNLEDTFLKLARSKNEF